MTLPGGSPTTRLRGKEGIRLPLFTMRFTLLVLILGLLVVSGAATNSVWFVKSRASSQVLSDQYFRLLARMVARRANDMLRPATYLLRQHKIEAQHGLLVVSDVADLGARLAERLRARPDLMQIYHAAADTGEFVGAWQTIGDTIVLGHSVPSVDAGAFSEWTIRSDGTRAQYRRDLQSGYDARQRIWFRKAIADPADHLVWTEPYVFFRSQRPGITAAEAWRFPGDTKPRGVFAADFSLDELSGFLTENSSQDGARSFLVTRQGQIIVSSKQGPGDPEDAVWPAIRASLPQSLSTLGLNRPINVAAQYGGADYLGVVQAFRITDGPEWVIVSVVPAARFLATPIANTKVAAAVGMFVVLAAIGLGWVVSDRVARPLLQITGDLEKVGQFDLSSDPTPRSFIHEIAAVSDGVDRMKTSLRSFSHYVPVDLVRDVIASGKETQLGGETRELTLLVSDIAGFTAVSERLAPAALVAQLAEYLEVVTAAIRAEGGTIDKYVGDGIVAFFNAPSPVPLHPAAACRSALAMQAAVATLQKEWAAVGLPAFPTRIGLNLGEVVVGNFGTRDRFAYTAMGDSMNLASRLEGLNKTYGTSVLASESVWRETNSAFEWRRLDRVAVIGRHQSTLVFELLGRIGGLSKSTLDARDEYEAALKAYFAGRLSKAAAGFAIAGRLRPDDRAAPVMAQRILDFARNPPEARWNGVFASDRK